MKGMNMVFAKVQNKLKFYYNLNSCTFFIISMLLERKSMKMKSRPLTINIKKRLLVYYEKKRESYRGKSSIRYKCNLT